MNLEVYTQEHGLELKNLLDSPAWQKAINSGLVDRVKSDRLEPKKLRPFIDTVLNQLLEFNEERARQLAGKNHITEEELLLELAKWPENLDGKDPIISFLGFNVTPECNFKPR